MFMRRYSNGKPGVELATELHQICRGNFSGVMRCRSIGIKESVYLLLEIQYRQLAYISLLIHWHLSLMMKAQVLAKVTEVLAIERRPLST